jgi:hypothetical protein
MDPNPEMPKWSLNIVLVIFHDQGDAKWIVIRGVPLLIAIRIDQDRSGLMRTLRILIFQSPDRSRVLIDPD